MRHFGSVVGPSVATTTLAAPGVWTMLEQQRLRRLTLWPTNGDAFFSSVFLLLSMDGTNGSQTITDTSGSPKTVTARGSAAISTAQSRFGGASCFCGGSGSYLTAPHPVLGENDFVIEAWLNFTSIPSGYATLWAGRATTGGYGGACLVSNSGSLEYFIANSFAFSWQIAGGQAGLSLSAGTWQHIALVRNGSAITAYKNGVAGSSVSIGSSSIGVNGSQMSLMAGSAAGGQEVTGYVDEFRFTVGTNRGYTGSTIPVPSQAFPGP